MKKVVVALLFLVLPLAAPARDAAGPRQNLSVELRWVDGRPSDAALAAAQGGVNLSTQRRADEGQQTQRLLVLNGASVRLQLTERRPIQWVDYTAQVDMAADAVGPGGPNVNPKVWVAPRRSVIEETQGFTVTPHWPGGRQPVRVEVQARGQAPGAAAGISVSGAGGEQASTQLTMQTVVLLPLGQWLTVARSGDAPQRQEPGVLSSRDAESRSPRELQIRVELVP